MKPFKQIINSTGRVIHALENLDIPFAYFILTFFFAVTLRNFIEVFSDRPSLNALEIFMHYYVFYAALAMTLILLFHALTRTEILKTARVILPCFMILNLAPVLDLILSPGRGYDMSYMLPGKHDNLILRFLTYFGDFHGQGITPGMRIEIATVLAGSFIYFYLKNSRFIRSLISVIPVYALIFIYTAFPFVVKTILEFTGLEFQPTNALFTDSYLVIIFLTGILLVLLTNGRHFKTIAKDIRPFRVMHYELMFVLGVILGMKNGAFKVDCTNLFHFVFIPISIVFAWLFSVVINNIEDYKIDIISNIGRPLVRSTVSLDLYKKLGWSFLGTALLYAGAVNFQTFFIVLLFIGNYFLYSAPPLRLKRITFFSKLLISVNSLILIMLGYVIVTGSIHNFPRVITIIFITAFTAAVNFIDIKDYEGDRQAGIKTLPVILGLKRAKLVIGLFFIIAYLSVYFAIGEIYSIKKVHLVFCLFLPGTVQFYLVNRKNYNEKYVFALYLSSMIALIILL